MEIDRFQHLSDSDLLVLAAREIRLPISASRESSSLITPPRYVNLWTCFSSYSSIVIARGSGQLKLHLEMLCLSGDLWQCRLHRLYRLRIGVLLWWRSESTCSPVVFCLEQLTVFFVAYVWRVFESMAQHRDKNRTNRVCASMQPCLSPVNYALKTTLKKLLSIQL